MNRKRKSWFFNSPSDDTGDRLRSQNIPSEETMKILLDSSAFIMEEEDGTSPTQQGLIKYYLNNDAIDNRDNPNLQSGNIHALLPNQAPGVGIENKGYKEGNPTIISPRNEVSGQGIKVTGLFNTNPTGIKRIGYQVEFDPITLSLYNPVTTDPLRFVVLDDGDEPKLYNMPASDIKNNHTHNQNVANDVWSVQHNLGFRPSVQVTLTRKPGFVIEALIEHVDENNYKVHLATSLSGISYAS